MPKYTEKLCQTLNCTADSYKQLRIPVLFILFIQFVNIPAYIKEY